ncbi:hypothetical protein MMC34_003742 [Xylographa carneopallida]|nr:hypothetical protein [Xylographa carneopallida]
MSTPAGAGWAQLRQQARSLETQTETLFHTYSQFSTPSTISPTPTDDEKKTEAQLEDILERVRAPTSPPPPQLLTTISPNQREALTSRLSLLLASSSDLTASALKQNNLSRHREILLDHRRELARLRAAIAAARDRANLLTTVRSDISAYRSANPEAAEADYMLDERRRIDNSHSIADSVLSQAYAVNENFGVQRETLASINRRIVGAASQVPGINGLMARIGAKKRRDGIILGSFIALCFLVLFYWG